MALPIIRFRHCQRGASAVEFALIAPVMLLLLFGIVAFGYVFGVYHGVQQIAAEAARASVAGMSDAERETLAREFVAAHLGSYALLEAGRLQVITAQSGPPRPSFEIAIRYDMSDTVFASVASLVALPPPVVERRAVVQRGGYCDALGPSRPGSEGTTRVAPVSGRPGRQRQPVLCLRDLRAVRLRRAGDRSRLLLL